MPNKEIHRAWIAAIVTFFTLMATAGFWATRSVLIGAGVVHAKFGKNVSEEIYAYA